MYDASEFYNPKLPWSGRAAELRGKQAGASLITELGRNYDAYHGELAESLAEVGRPEPAQYKTLDAYREAWSTVQHIVMAEHLLRVARIVSAGDRPPQIADRPPLLDDKDRLLHFDDALKLQKSGAPASP